MEKSNRSFREAVARSFGGDGKNKLHFVPPYSTLHAKDKCSRLFYINGRYEVQQKKSKGLIAYLGEECRWYLGQQWRATHPPLMTHPQ